MDSYKGMTIGERFLKDGIDDLIETCFKDAQEKGWHNDLTTGAPLPVLPGESIMLMVCELAEAYEGVRKGLNDTHLPDRLAEEVELADAVIRICHYARRRGFDLSGAIVEKLRYNRTREDHKRKNRLKDGGKKF